MRENRSSLSCGFQCPQVLCVLRTLVPTQAAGQDSLLSHAGDTWTLGEEATLTSSEPAPHLLPVLILYFQLHPPFNLTLFPPEMTQGQIISNLLCSIWSLSKENGNIYICFIKFWNRLCNSAFQVSIHGKCSSNVFSQSLHFVG